MLKVVVAEYRPRQAEQILLGYNVKGDRCQVPSTGRPSLGRGMRMIRFGRAEAGHASKNPREQGLI
jgi:hypothetical protein